MADIKNKNELKRRIDLFLDELDYSINEKFCKETMKMMKEFIGHASHRLDCEDSRVKSLKKKLKEYKDLEEQGLLLRLPCGIGADIYFIPSKTNYKLNILQGYPESNRVYHQTVERITYTPNGWYLEGDKDLEYATDHILVDKLYKETWFLSQAEAEQKLKEMENR